MPPGDPGAPAPPPPEPEQVLREARAKFVAGFSRQADRIERLVGETDARAREELRFVVHRIAGFGGTVGLPAVSARAAELEEWLGRPENPPFDVGLGRDLVGALREAFARDLAAPPAWPREADQPAGRRLVVLIVEDDAEVVGIVDAQLRAVGCETTIAFDGRQAVDLVRTLAPDVLVLDLMMPKMSGFDVLDAVRALESRPAVIVLSGRGREDDVARAFALGADDYMIKPFSPQELRTRIGRLLK